MNTNESSTESKGKQVGDEIPRLSPSTAKLILRSPAHCYAGHRLLGGGAGVDESTIAQNTGKILEALVYNQPLEKHFAILPYSDFKTKRAKAARDLAISERKTPVKAKDLEEFEAAADTIKRQLAEQGIVFEGGEYQKLIEWTCTLTGANCKGYIDYWDPSKAIIWDLKCVDDASPSKVVRSFVDYGWDVARAAYTDGIETLYPELAGRTRMIFPFAETSPPYLVHLYEAGGEMRLLGDEKWHRAKQEWVNCLEKNFWPGYFTGIAQLNPTPWQMAALSAEIETEEVAK